MWQKHKNKKLSRVTGQVPVTLIGPLRSEQLDEIRLNEIRNITQHILLNSWQGRMRDHAAIANSTERAQTLPVGSVDLRHAEVAEVALCEQQVLPPQGGAVWVEEHLKMPVDQTRVMSG